MSFALLALYGICLFVGLLVGGTGMGGILIPPALVLLSGLTTHAAMATTLTSFIPMNVAGCYFFHKMGHLDWIRAIPLTLGGALSAGPFALWNTHFQASFLTMLLGLLVLFAGFSAYHPPKSLQNDSESFWQTKAGLFIIGATTGTVAGLTGAGGPLLAIAWMVTFGMHPLSAVGLSMPYSLATAISATIFNIHNHNVDFPLLWRVGTIEFIGFLAGIYLVARMPVLWVRRLMALTCFLLGLFLLFKSIWGM